MIVVLTTFSKKYDDYEDDDELGDTILLSKEFSNSMAHIIDSFNEVDDDEMSYLGMDCNGIWIMNNNINQAI